MKVEGERERVRDIKDVSSVRIHKETTSAQATRCYKPNNFISLPSRFASKYPFHLVHYKLSIYEQVPRCILVVHF